MKKDFEQICIDLEIDWKSLEPLFQEAWGSFLDAMRLKSIRTWTYKEAFLSWLLVLKFKPKAILELGSQHGHSGRVWAHAAKQVGALFLALELGDDIRNKYPSESRGTMRFLPDDDPFIVKIWGDAEELLPSILEKYPIQMVFHDCAHTYDHVENCLNIIQRHDSNIVQLCHDCAEGMWQPTDLRYGLPVCAERIVFDKHFLGNESYYYAVFEDKYGIGVLIKHGNHNKG